MVKTTNQYINHGYFRDVKLKKRVTKRNSMGIQRTIFMDVSTKYLQVYVMKKTLQHGFFIIRIFFDLDLDDTCSDLFRFYCGTIDFWDFCSQIGQIQEAKQWDPRVKFFSKILTSQHQLPSGKRLHSYVCELENDHIYS